MTMLARVAQLAWRSLAARALPRALAGGCGAASHSQLPLLVFARPRSRLLSTEAAAPASPLAAFLDPYDLDPLTPAPGRAWTADELRKKSSPDLEKIWIVLCKERNMLLSSRYHHGVMKTEMKFPERIRTVRVSMARLKHVVRERNVFEEQLAQERKQRRFEGFMRPPPPPPAPPERENSPAQMA